MLSSLIMIPMKSFLTLSRRKPLSYRNHSIDLQSKSVDWFLCYNGLRHERVNHLNQQEKNKALVSLFNQFNSIFLNLQKPIVYH